MIDLTNKEVRLTGTIVEHLRMGKKEWFSIRFPNNQTITIASKFCKVQEGKADES